MFDAVGPPPCGRPTFTRNACDRATAHRSMEGNESASMSQVATDLCVTAAVEKALGPCAPLSDRAPLAYSVRESAHLHCSSTTTRRGLVEEGCAAWCASDSREGSGRISTI
jgi:hypothetical protein